MPSGFFTALREVAGSPFALLGYALLLASWTYIAVTRHRLQRIASVIDKIPEDQRAALLAREFSTFPRSGLSAEQWLRSQRHRMVFLALLALLIVTSLVICIALVERSRRSDVVTKRVDWQMFLYLGAIGAFTDEGKLWEMECGSEAKPPPALHLPRQQTIRMAANIRLVVDNLFRTHRGLIYPVGFSTTWDRKVHVVYDGLDVETERAGTSTTMFTRSLVCQVTIQTPTTAGPQYLVFLTGAALEARQLFFFRADAQQSSQSFWDIPHTSLQERKCGGYLEHPFVRNDGIVENVMFPIIAVPVEID